MKKISINIFLISITFLLPVIISSFTESLGYSAQAASDEKKFKNVKFRKRASVGAACGKALEKVQVVIEEEDWPKSMEMLEGIEADTKTCKSPYEQTQLWKFKGYVYYSLDDFPGAIRSYKLVINGEGTPEDLRLDTRYTLAQLYIAEERYEDAADELAIYIAELPLVHNTAWGILVQLYFQLDRKEESQFALKQLEHYISQSNKVSEGSIKLLTKIYEMMLTNEKSKIELDTTISKSRPFSKDSDYIPVYVPQPVYPRRAQTRGKEGYAVVQVIITTAGGVRDPVMIEEYPEGWGFGRSAVQAAKKLKYNPRIVDGVAEEQSGVLYKFTFGMAK